jgi:hypothetical protein
MEEIFNPSLIISLGPSGRKALDFSKKLLGHLPAHFLNLIDYYEVGSLEGISNKLQEVIDTKLLSARQLNKLVDLGYKVRSENTNVVRLNLYLFWDVYGSELHAYEAVKAISELNFGNIDKNQHSGVSLYIIPMMEREWVLDEKKSIESVEGLSQVVSLISKEESMLTMDSKVYILHSVSNDGTRIPMQELEYVGGMLAYLNVIPSKHPPLAHFNRRLLRNEAAYKVGTIGITSLIVFKDKLLKDFSKYLSLDILKHSSEYEANENYKNYELFKLIAFESQRNVLKQGVNIIEDEEAFNLTKDIAKYPAIFKAWEESIEKQYLTDIKRIIDNNAEENTKAVIKNIERDLRAVTLNSSLKEGVNYINELEGEIAKQGPNNKSSLHIDTSALNEELQARVNRYPKFLAYFNYRFLNKRLHRFMDSYKEEVIKKAGNLINIYIEKSIAEGYKHILSYLAARKQTLYNCINNAKELSMSIAPIPQDEEAMGSLITDLLSFKDRYDFYKERRPRISEDYRSFLIEMESFEKFTDKTLSSKLKDYTLRASRDYVDLDFFEYMSFKYKKDINEQLCKWIDKGIVKANYLLQYINNEFLEEYSLFIASPQVYRAINSIPSGNLSNFQAYTNSMSIIRLCLGVNIDNITSVKKLKEKDKTSIV